LCDIIKLELLFILRDLSNIILKIERFFQLKKGTTPRLAPSNTNEHAYSNALLPVYDFPSPSASAGFLISILSINTFLFPLYTKLLFHDSRLFVFFIQQSRLCLLALFIFKRCGFYKKRQLSRKSDRLTIF